MEDQLKPRFNPVMPFLRGLLAVISAALAIWLVAAFSLLLHHKGFQTIYLLHVAGHLLFVWLTYHLLRELILQTRGYQLLSDCIIQTNYLNGIVRRIDRQEILGYSSLSHHFGPFRFRFLTILLRNGKILRLRPYEFLNLQEAERVIRELGYPECGPEFHCRNTG